MSSLAGTTTTDPKRPAYMQAVGLNTASAIFTQVIGFGRSLILTRLLTPDDYGIFSLTFVVTAAVQTLVNFNMANNVIRRKFTSLEEQNRYLDTTWSLELLRQVVVCAILLVLSWPAAKYFKDERLFPVLMLCSITPLINGCANVGMVLLRKDIQFKNIVVHRQLSEVLTTIFAIVVALFTRNVWALASSQVVGAIVSCLLSYRFHPYRPSFGIDRAVLRESLSFSSHLFLVTLFTYITTQFDNLVVGRYLGTAIVGIYILAYRLSNLSCEAISEILSPVSFPAYSRIRQENPDQLPGAFELISTAGIAAVIATTLPLRLCAEWLIPFMYGAKWQAAAPLLGTLVFVGILRGSARIISPLFLALEKPSVESSSKALEAFLFIALNLVLVPKYQATGAIIAGIVSYAVAFLIRFVVSLAAFPGHSWHLFFQISLVFASAGVAYGMASALRPVLFHDLVAVVVFELVFATLLFLTIASIRRKIFSVFPLAKLRAV